MSLGPQSASQTSAANGWRRLETWLVVAIAAHSYAVGLLLVFASRWSVGLGGWLQPPDTFFVHQGGVFHLAVATGYLYEYFRYRGVGLIVIAKSCATAFLVLSALHGGAWAVPFSALVDGGMLAAALVVRGRVRRAERGERIAGVRRAV